MSLEETWYQRHPVRWLLLPVSLVYYLVVVVRRACYRQGWLKSERMPVPVIVVGNITVGGTGKTPLVIWLVEHLRQRGWKPGIVSRGYGGHSPHWPRSVKVDSDPAEVGDEPVLLAQRLNCPIVVSPSRVGAARMLLSDSDVDMIVSDDGLQHYALARDIEISVIDAQRRLGNGLLLPAGPLREPAQRLQEVDGVIMNGGEVSGRAMSLRATKVIRLDGGGSRPLSEFAGHTVLGLAGIGHPERFISTLRDAGLQVMPRIFPDHHRFKADDIDGPDTMDVIMTEKDAVKCRHFAGPRHWYLRVEAELSADASEMMDSLIDRISHQDQAYGQEAT